MKKLVLSDHVWDKVLEALGIERDKDEPMMKMTITLECRQPVVVEQKKYVRDE